MTFNRTRGWKKQQPQSIAERRSMKKKCGKKCFLGPKLSYPICKRKTCKISSQGTQSAYIRARQYHKQGIAGHAKRILKYFFPK
jgi:hypothetical protein